MYNPPVARCEKYCSRFQRDDSAWVASAGSGPQSRERRRRALNRTRNRRPIFTYRHRPAKAAKCKTTMKTASCFCVVGSAAAIVLGFALVPLRDLTSASNLSFAFMALTIVVAEYGGRRAAVATALCSALSLDFFLTRPYLRLTIVDKHDIVAFLGLGVCGLIAAALGSQRGRRTASLKSAMRQLDLLNTAVEGLRKRRTSPFQAGEDSRRDVRRRSHRSCGHP